MVRLQKLAKQVSKAINAFARILMAMGLALARFAERIEKHSTSK